MTRRSALITGGSAGIGFAIAAVLVEDGWDVTIAARDGAKLDAAATALRAGGSTVHTIAANFATEAPQPVVAEHIGVHRASTCSSRTAASACSDRLRPRPSRRWTSM